MPTPRLPIIFGGIAIADVLLEVPIIKIAKLYTYYGDNQPFFNEHWFPLPLWFISTNRLFDLVPAMQLRVSLRCSGFGEQSIRIAYGVT